MMLSQQSPTPWLTTGERSMTGLPQHQFLSPPITTLLMRLATAPTTSLARRLATTDLMSTTSEKVSYPLTYPASNTLHFAHFERLYMRSAPLFSPYFNPF